MRDNSFIRTLLVVLFISSGLVIGIMLVPVLEGQGRLQYLTAIVVVVIIVLIVTSIRFYLTGKKKAHETSGKTGEGSETGFIVDTFHDLVAKLKEKEKELEKLKSFAEEKAVRIEAYNENVLQSVPSGVISIDNAMNIKSMNQAAERILGIESKEIIERKFDVVFKEPFTTLLSEAKTVSRAEYPYVTHDGRHIWLGITMSMLHNTAGDKIGLIFVFTDLTDIKALQAQVELKQRLSQLGEMSAGISHELRNSMAVIAGYARLLSKKVDPSNQNTVHSILSEISSMDKIISELLAFAKPTVLSRDRMDLGELVKETVEAVTGDNESVKVTVKIDGPIPIMADRVLLRQALSNLFINAIEAMPEGGSLDIDTRRLQNSVKIIIRDTGPGIPEDVRQKIFLPFYTTKQEGTGLGLALVQKIIVSHGGNIEVESKKGEGAAFRIILPAEM